MRSFFRVMLAASMLAAAVHLSPSSGEMNLVATPAAARDCSRENLDPFCRAQLEEWRAQEREILACVRGIADLRKKEADKIRLQWNDPEFLEAISGEWRGYVYAPSRPNWRAEAVLILKFGSDNLPPWSVAAHFRNEWCNGMKAEWTRTGDVTSDVIYLGGGDHGDWLLHLFQVGHDTYQFRRYQGWANMEDGTRVPLQFVWEKRIPDLPLSQASQR